VTARLATLAIVVAAIVAAVGCGGSGDDRIPDAGLVSHHEPGQGWTADVPAGWRAVAPGPAFVRGDPLADPTRLIVEAYPDRTPAAALGAFSAMHGVRVTSRAGTRAHGAARWVHYRGLTSGGRPLAAELAVARHGADADVAALVARPGELGRLARTVLSPALDSFVAGAPDPPRSVLETDVADPPYWPTAGWRAASPASQGMDGARLDAMLAKIRSARLPIDSVTVIRHGYVVTDASFGRFAAGTLGEPYASGRLHELQSATKSITSMLLGIALGEHPGSGVTTDTPVLALAAAVDYVPRHLDGRKRAMTLEDLLTMQSGLHWTESGHAYAPGSGNDVIGMLRTADWGRFVIDRPMARRPGTSFEYNTGAAHLVSGAVSVLTRRPGDELAAARLFAPLGIGAVEWRRAPEGVTSGGFGLLLQPRDLAKLGFLVLHRGRWDGRQIVPAEWVERSTTDHAASPSHEYGYLWWLDDADRYAYMAGLYGQLVVVHPAKDLVAVITGHIPATEDSSAVTRWLFEEYVLPAAH
jgi:CubicO group peptidase (beta-lactamase class C family)